MPTVGKQEKTVWRQCPQWANKKKYFGSNAHNGQARKSCLATKPTIGKQEKVVWQQCPQWAKLLQLILMFFVDEYNIFKFEY